MNAILSILDLYTQSRQSIEQERTINFVFTKTDTKFNTQYNNP